MAAMEEPPRNSCLKLEVPGQDVFFIKGTWYDSRFVLSITDGGSAWVCNASEEEVRQRAEQWDLPVSEYVELTERYLGFQQPGSRYGFDDAGSGHRRLSWTFDKKGTRLEWRWKCQSSSIDKQVTVEILGFLMEANIHLSEAVVKKTQSYDKLRHEAEICLSRSEKLCIEKVEFETKVYAKFVAVLNSKKAKLRELRDKIAKLQSGGHASAEEDGSTDKTEIYDEESDDAWVKKEDVENVVDGAVGENRGDDDPGPSNKASTSKPRGHKRKSGK